MDNDHPTVTVRVPGLLTRFTGDQRSVTVQAETGPACLDALVEAYPALAPHLFDTAGRLRPHLKLFHNGSEFTLDDGVTLVDGDEVLVLQAVSGGSGAGRSQRLRPPASNG